MLEPEIARFEVGTSFKLGMASGTAVKILLHHDQTDYGNLFVNLFFLATCFGLLRVFSFSLEDLGLRVNKRQMRCHLIMSSTVFCLSMLFYIFAIRISILQPFSVNPAYGFITYLVVVIAEELYFRDALYGYLDKRFSTKITLIVSSVLVGLFHAHQGLINMIQRTFTGWLRARVSYSSE